MIQSKYRIFTYVDDADYKWCKKRGTWCHKSDYGWMCDECNRR